MTHLEIRDRVEMILYSWFGQGRLGEDGTISTVFVGMVV